MCKGNDIQGKVEGSRSDRTVEPGETGSVEAQAEERGFGGMTWAQMGVSPAETSRRQKVVDRMNLLWSKRNHTDDSQKQKRIDRELSRIRADESFWLKEAAFFLY
jgi:hypothetical protein